VVRTVHATLLGQGAVSENLAGLGKALERLSRGGHW
jgi:hypothetical protein